MSFIAIFKMVWINLVHLFYFAKIATLSARKASINNLFMYTHTTRIIDANYSKHAHTSEKMHCKTTKGFQDYFHNPDDTLRCRMGALERSVEERWLENIGDKKWYVRATVVYMQSINNMYIWHENTCFCGTTFRQLSNELVALMHFHPERHRAVPSLK